jgi:glycosyltransferase involved in cell wall biosynthesis
LVDPGDHGAIARHGIHLLENPLLARTMGEAARCSAERYRMDGIIDQFESLYLKLVAGRKRYN